MNKRRILLTEFAIQVYSDDRIVWNGFDSFLWWWLHRGRREELLPFAAKIADFGRQPRPKKKSK